MPGELAGARADEASPPPSAGLAVTVADCREIQARGNDYLAAAGAEIRYRAIVSGQVVAAKRRATRKAEGGAAREWAAMHDDNGMPLRRRASPSAETREKLRQAALGRAKSPEWRAAIGAGNRGKPRSPEWRARMSEIMRAKRNFENTKSKQGDRRGD